MTSPKRLNRYRPAWVKMVREYDPTLSEPVKIAGPADVQRVLKARAVSELVEVFYVLLLNTAGQLTELVEVTRGILNSSLVHPREVFRLAVAHGAAGIIVAHNHPSGDSTPSADDRAVTRQLVEAGRVLDIPVHDHVIIAGERYLSFAEAGLL